MVTGTHNTHQAQTRSKPIYCHQTEIVYISSKDASDMLGLRESNICKVLKGERKQTDGYTFEYVYRSDTE